MGPEVDGPVRGNEANKADPVARFFVSITEMAKAVLAWLIWYRSDVFEIRHCSNPRLSCGSEIISFHRGLAYGHPARGSEELTLFS